MPRVGAQLTTALSILSESLGNPGIEALYTAARRRNIQVTRKQVQDLVKSKSEKQVLGAPQRAAGKTVSENDNRWQMDLIDVTNVPSGDWTFFLVCVNVVDRFMYAAPLRTKSGTEVAKELGNILKSAAQNGRKKPQIISSDNGSEFVNPDVAKLLSARKIEHKFKDVGDVNALGLLDRQIGLLKRRLAELHARNDKSWAVNLPGAVGALNRTPKPDVLHGAAPEDVHKDPEVQFMLMQDNARSVQSNANAVQKRGTELEQTGTFRPQVAVSKFKRNFQATYGNPEQVQRVEGSRVYSTSGQNYPLKQVRIVPVGAAAVKGSHTVPNQKLARGGNEILGMVENILEGSEPMAISKVALELKEIFLQHKKDYKEILKKVGGQLIDLIRLQPDRFKLVPRPHGPQTWYFVSLA